MYIFEAHYTNMDNNEEITRKIEFDGQFMENDKECYMYAMNKAYESRTVTVKSKSTRHSTRTESTRLTQSLTHGKQQ